MFEVSGVNFPWVAECERLVECLVLLWLPSAHPGLSCGMGKDWAQILLDVPLWVFCLSFLHGGEGRGVCCGRGPDHLLLNVVNDDNRRLVLSGKMAQWWNWCRKLSRWWNLLFLLLWLPKGISWPSKAAGCVAEGRGLAERCGGNRLLRWTGESTRYSLRSDIIQGDHLVNVRKSEFCNVRNEEKVLLLLFSSFQQWVGKFCSLMSVCKVWQRRLGARPWLFLNRAQYLPFLVACRTSFLLCSELYSWIWGKENFNKFIGEEFPQWVLEMECA